MKVVNWNPRKADAAIASASMERLRDAAEIIAHEVRNNTPVGTIDRPMYQTGKYAGQAWTKRDAGQLRGSVRVVEKIERFGFEVDNARNIRIYVGNYFAYYAAMVEFYKPFFRPAWRRSLAAAKRAITGGTNAFKKAA